MKSVAQGLPTSIVLVFETNDIYLDPNDLPMLEIAYCPAVWSFSLFRDSTPGSYMFTGPLKATCGYMTECWPKLRVQFLGCALSSS